MATSRKKAFYKGICLILFPVFLFLSNAYSYFQTNGYEYQVPKKLNDGWEVSSLTKEGIDKVAIEKISREIADIDSYENVLSMLIVKNGRIVHEVYSPYCQRNTLHWMASITKTITSTLIGIAIDKGFIASVDTKLHELLPQFADDFKGPGKKKIALKHIMSMTSGIDWNERISYNNPRNSEWQMVESEDWMSDVLSHPAKDEPGKIFNYNTGGIHLLSAVI